MTNREVFKIFSIKSYYQASFLFSWVNLRVAASSKPYSFPLSANFGDHLIAQCTYTLFASTNPPPFHPDNIFVGIRGCLKVPRTKAQEREDR